MVEVTPSNGYLGYLWGIAIVFVTASLAGIGYIIKRHLTGRAFLDEHESLSKAVDLSEKLNEHGLSIDEARQLRDEYRRSAGGYWAWVDSLKSEKAKDDEERNKGSVFLYRDEGSPDDLGEDDEVSFEDTTVGMKIKAGSELEVLSAVLDHEIEKLRQTCSDARARSLDTAQAVWERYRDADAELSSLNYEGGSMAGLIYLARQIDITESRIEEIRQLNREARI